ncbi:hypothetical protein BDK51DRAFT_38732 [Blyttiomyces helicus]|uniref:F-box domain-containing protein n=1 Tax=Blyttiomyces helicus TaxID=388810 RepID=A0A4P9W2X7_9FUNG|nr:hypothetical protein BDK51DRAFT_38732 [Blyttiomyces helicus]|eukprot:RKO86611.1 hypothetical protein BDK51DRAFT_38732 [Blyttiomyces helicus]
MGVRGVGVCRVLRFAAPARPSRASPALGAIFFEVGPSGLKQRWGVLPTSVQAHKSGPGQRAVAGLVVAVVYPYLLPRPIEGEEAAYAPRTEAGAAAWHRGARRRHPAVRSACWPSSSSSSVLPLPLVCSLSSPSCSTSTSTDLHLGLDLATESNPSPASVIVAAADAEEDVGLLPNPRLVRLPTELLQKVFKNLGDRRIRGHRCSDLRSAALVCRAWEPVASERMLTYVELNCSMVDMVKSFEDCNRAGATRNRIATVREIRIVNWQGRAYSGFTSFLPQLRGLRVFFCSLSGGNKHAGPPAAVVATLFSSCPLLEALDMAAPTPQGLDPEADGGLSGDDIAAVPCGVGRLKSLRLFVAPAGGHYSPAALELQNLPIRSVGAPVEELQLTVADGPGWRSPRVPLFPAEALRNLKVVEVVGNSNIIRPLIETRPPLHRVAVGYELCKAPRRMTALLRACPSIVDLDRVYSASCAPGTALRLLGLRDNSFADGALLACIDVLAETSPRLEILRLHITSPKYRVTLILLLEDVAFLADLKRGYPNLRYVGLGADYLDRRRVPAEAVQFIADVKVDILKSLFELEE